MAWQASPLNRRWHPLEPICSHLLTVNLHAKRFYKSQTGGKRPGCAALQKATRPGTKHRSAVRLAYERMAAIRDAKEAS
jgi:hypothetical protein